MPSAVARDAGRPTTHEGMSQAIVKYAQPEALASPLLLSPPETVPPVDELERVEQELKALKQKSFERAKKADDDLRTIEVAMRKMREMEKGKARAMSKVKREPSYTPSLGAEDRSSPGQPSTSSKTQVNGNAIYSSGVALPKSVLDMKQKLKKKDKDKKRKRDVDDSDGEHDAQRPRKFSPLPPSHKETHTYKPTTLRTVTHPKTSSGLDWNLPTQHPLLAPRPQIPQPLPPGPRKPIEVTEDFTKAKTTTQQVPIGTFYTSIEPWLRPIKEEDVGWLEFTADEVEPYIVPKLGRHYTEVWEEEDINLFGGLPVQLDFSSSRNHTSSSSGLPAPLPKWDPSTITDSDLASDKGLGSITERLVTALLPNTDQAKVKGIKEAEDALDAKLTASGSNTNNTSLPKEKVFVSDLEERIKDAARHYGLLDGDPDFSQTNDDPISTALRKAQRQLRAVVATNKARKARLAEIARERLAYQEYVDIRDGLDKNIASTYAKLLKKDGPKATKKKKKSETNGGVNGINGAGGPPAPLPNPASLGLTHDEEGQLVVPESLMNLVHTRGQWEECIGKAFEERERESYGGRGLPSRSVFEGVDAEVRRQLNQYAGRPCGPGAVDVPMDGSSSQTNGVT
ncbi:hypothetical protein SCHPADRAFT_898578 [Schizopora paradoxa]|uniref:Uncharacterized protein n=1 Tax=Schizopora paradoxa TaxID=27342 RepID=A0A0H2S6N8_9AGAM|nr:hypothetical protein SCHPADRAFT_898578 [Schizopora paradoxa]